MGGVTNYFGDYGRIGIGIPLTHTHRISNGKEQTQRPLRLGASVIFFLAIACVDCPAYCRG